MSANGILQKQQCVYGLKHDITIVPHSLVPTILHEFLVSKDHHGNIGTFEAVRNLNGGPNYDMIL